MSVVGDYLSKARKTLLAMDERPFVFLLIVTAFFLLSGQFQWGYVHHDDLDWLVSSDELRGYATPWEKTLYEGRWLNFLWSYISVHLTPQVTSGAFLTALAISSWLFSSIVKNSKGSTIVASAIFFAPMFGDLSLWPSTLLPAFTLLALALWLIRSSPSGPNDLVVLGTGVFFSLLTHPVIAGIILLAFALKNAPSTRTLFHGMGVFLLAYLMAILFIFSANSIFHGNFGVDIESWRKPNPASDVSSIIANAGMFWHDLVESTSSVKIVAVVALAPFLLCLGRSWARRRLWVVCAGVALLIFINALLTIKTGVHIPARAKPYIWLVLVIPSGLLFRVNHGFGQISIATSALGVALVTGFLTWVELYSGGVQYQREEYKLVQSILAKGDGDKIKKLPFSGDPKNVPRFWRMLSKNHMMLSIYKRYGIKLVPCSGKLCDDIRAASADGFIVKLDRKLALKFPE